MNTAERGLREFMSGEPLSVKIYEMDQPDVPLWAVWAIQQYAKYAGRDKAFEMYGKLLQDIIIYIKNDKHPNLRLDDNGLLYADGRDKAITWMNSKARSWKNWPPRQRNRLLIPLSTNTVTCSTMLTAT